MRIKDVAREAGVSTATVSHVINNTRYVSEETRAKVLRAIEACNYYPNAHARSLASGRSQMLGVLVSDIANPFFPELVKSIEAAAFERGYDVLLLNTNYDAERTLHYVQRIIQRKVAGVALMTSELDGALIAELARCHISVAFLDLGTKGVCMSNLIVDYQSGIEEAVRHLVERGHRRIAYIGGPTRLRSSVKRLDAFRDSLRRHLSEGPQPVIYEGDFRLEGGIQAARKILAESPRPTAVIAANDMMALGLMRECRANGLSIPQDISVVGFDDIAFAELADPALTTVCLPRDELGQKAVEALMMMIGHPDQEGIDVHIATHLVERSSTACIRASEE